MEKWPDVVGVVLRCVCSRRNGSYGTVLDREPAGICSGRRNRATVGVRNARRVLVSKKARLLAIVVVVLFVSALAQVLLAGRMPSTANPSRTLTLSDPVWTAEGDQEGAAFGFSASFGDVNGDGYADVVIGALQYDNGQLDEGRAYLYLGSSSGLSATPSWTAESDRESALYGHAVSSAGDVNGDGYDDVIIGAYAYDNGQTDEGGAFLYLGSSSGLSATPSWTVEGDKDYADFGCSVSSAGDVNGDGYDDVVVGAMGYDNGETAEGRAFLYLGSSSGLSATPSWTAEGDQVGAVFGILVSIVGDVNGDGYDDVVIGAIGYSNGQMAEGRAFLYLGSSSGLSAAPSWTAESDQTEAYFGVVGQSSGDVNGDGYDDVFVGAYQYDNGQWNEGGAFLYLGSSSGLSATPSWTAESDQEGARFGTPLAFAGDVNADGYDDVIVGAHNYDNGQLDEGRAYLYLGSSSGLSATPSWTAESDQEGAFYGFGVSSAGDVNGDGCDDVIVGAHFYDNGQTDEGRAYLYFGSLGLHSPVALFDYWPTDPVVDEIITFDASSSYDPDGDIVSYVWDFGDGTTEDGVVTTHAYAAHGTYLLALTVTDDDGLNSSVRVAISVLRTSLDVQLKAGSVHFRGETAEFYVLVSSLGRSVGANMSAWLYYDGQLYENLSFSVECISPGLYRIPYVIPLDAPTGTYALVVEALHLNLSGISLECFLLSPTLNSWNALLIEVNGSVGIIKTDLGLIEVELDSISARLISIDEGMAVIDSAIGTIRADLSSINAKLATLNNTVATIQTDLGPITTDIANILLVVTAVNGTLTTIQTTLGTFEGRIASIDGNVATIETDIGVVKADLSGFKEDQEEFAIPLYVLMTLMVAVVVGVSLLVFLVRRKP